MRKVSRFLSAVAIATIAVTGCGDGGGGGGTNTGDPLTAAESQEVFALLFALGFAVAAPPQGPMAATGPMAVPFNETINESASCPGGGSVGLSGSVSGDIDPSTFDGTINMDVTENINSCVVTSGSTNFTVNGDPNIRIQADITLSNGGQSFGGTFGMTGGFTYTSNDGRSGGCAVNVQVNLTNFSASGSVCGESITSTGA